MVAVWSSFALFFNVLPLPCKCPRSSPCHVKERKQFRGSLRAAILVSFFVAPIRVKLVQFQDFSYPSICRGVRNANPTLAVQHSLGGTIITMHAAVFLCTIFPIAMLLYHTLLRKWRFFLSPSTSLGCSNPFRFLHGATAHVAYLTTLATTNFSQYVFNILMHF